MRRLLLAAALLIGATTPLAARDVPFLSGRVNDSAAIMPAEVRDRLEARLAAFEKETGAQIAVLTIDSLDGEVLEEYAHRVASTWQLGRKGKDDGALLLVAKSDRKMRIEVGYGLEGTLTDIATKRILDNVVRPRFRDGDFGGGIEAGVEAMLGTVAGKADAVPAEQPAGSPAAMETAPWEVRLMVAVMFFLVVGIFSMLAVFGKGCMSWFMYAFLMPFYLMFPMAFAGPSGGIVFFAAWLIGFPLLKLVFARSGFGKRWLAAHPALVAFAAASGRSSSGGWSSGGGSSSGGFSGGGGSFGGGGSSSSW